MAGLYDWNTRSTPSPGEILRTVKEEFRPRLLLAMTTPSYAWTRSRSPSTTLTCTTTVSPGLNSGSLRVARSSFSFLFILFIAVAFPITCVIDPTVFHPPRGCRALEFLEEIALLAAHPAPLQKVRPA